MPLPLAAPHTHTLSHALCPNTPYLHHTPLIFPTPTPHKHLPPVPIHTPTPLHSHPPYPTPTHHLSTPPMSPHPTHPTHSTHPHAHPYSHTGMRNTGGCFISQWRKDGPFSQYRWNNLPPYGKDKIRSLPNASNMRLNSRWDKIPSVKSKT